MKVVLVSRKGNASRSSFHHFYSAHLSESGDEVSYYLVSCVNRFNHSRVPMCLAYKLINPGFIVSFIGSFLIQHKLEACKI